MRRKRPASDEKKRDEDQSKGDQLVRTSPRNMLCALVCARALRREPFRGQSRHGLGAPHPAPPAPPGPPGPPIIGPMSRSGRVRRGQSSFMRQDANIGRGPARRDLWPGQRPKPLLRVIYMSLRAVFDRMRARLLQCDTSEIPPPFFRFTCEPFRRRSGNPILPPN